MSKKILISGATGLVGTALIERLSGLGYECFSLVRREPKNSFEIAWNPNEGIVGKLPQGVGAVVNLAGENIAGGLWSIERKNRLWNSRVNSTALLVKTCLAQDVPPAVFISASGSGIYKDYGDQEIKEDGLVGDGFLAHLASAWEGEAHKGEPHMRVVLLRIGMVITKKGGALAKMLTPFKFGLGGTLGSGKQYMSWIHLEDLVSVIQFCIENQKIVGPVNAVAPRPVTNKEFTRALGGVLHRPTILPAPALALKLFLGGLARELLLMSQRVVPNKLLAAGFRFRYENIESAFKAEIN